ncbi:MAG: helix-turn-helix transcriptional regulator [Candidatus Scatosoma sp.]
MESLESKKLALIRILQILETYTDGAHLLKYNEIVSKLSADYGLVVERKAIGRNLSLLKEAGYDVVTTPKGTYLNSRAFEESEIRLLIDGVLSSRHINATHSKELIDKLSGLSNVYFKSRVKSVYSVRDWNKSENIALFYNVDAIDEAISKKVKLRFDYNKYGKDKKMHRSASHTVSPYQMILHNQRYFLMAFQEKWQHISYYRLDRITNIELTNMPATPLRSLSGYENGIDYKRFSSSLPYMFSDDPVPVTFTVSGEWMFDQIIDWFGYRYRAETKDGKIFVTVIASQNAMEYWAMQYLNAVEILTPVALRERIKNNVQNAVEKYK